MIGAQDLAMSLWLVNLVKPRIFGAVRAKCLIMNCRYLSVSESDDVGALVNSYKDWHIPYTRDDMILQQALDSLSCVRADTIESLLMFKLAGNPKLNHTGLELFNGSLDVTQLDSIHILLGRGLLNIDAAFTAGFTLGSSKKIKRPEQSLVALVAKHLTPDVYAFSEEEMAVFKEGIRMAYISGCSPLDQFNFNEWLDQPIRTVRDAIGIEDELILAYFAVEQRRYPLSLASQRLLPPAQKIVAF